jgi:SSS family solute:Na+ symporter
LTGVLAFALFGKVVGDPDMIWGYATSQLLGPGFVGLMIACLLAAAMSSADAFMISGSALFTKNLYQPKFPDKPESHYVFVGRVVSVVMIAGAIALSLYFKNVLSLIKYIWQLPIIFGAVFWLSILWRRVTKAAALTAAIYSGIMIIVLPNLLPQFDAISENEHLLKYTNERIIIVNDGATAQDVQSGLADEVGDVIRKEHTVTPVPGLFDDIVREKIDQGVQLKGSGKLSPNLLILHLFGIDLRGFSKSGLMTISYIMDILAPFILMFLVSWFTTPVNAGILNRFYARFHTPVHTDLEQDKKEIERSTQDTSRFDDRKLFPNSNWELMKPTPVVFWGFWACAGIAVLVLAFAFLISNIRIP